MSPLSPRRTASISPQRLVAVLSVLGLVAAIGAGCGFSSLHAEDCSADVDFGNVDPAWSPDGRKVAFVGTPTVSDCHIYVMNANGTNRRELTKKSSYYQLGSSAWSPDGRKIAFAGGDGIYVMNADGSKQRRLASASASSGCSGCTSDESAAWSPDGRRIAYDNLDTGLYVMDADGSDRQRLTPDSASDFEPSWSADSQKIAFGHETSGNAHFVSITDADGHNRRRLHTPDGSHSPAWSPDGREIAFVSTGDSGRDRIFVMNADGRQQRQLTRHACCDDESPAWSPDGRTILFSRGRDVTSPPTFPRTSWQIYAINLDGSDEHALTHK